MLGSFAPLLAERRVGRAVGQVAQHVGRFADDVDFEGKHLAVGLRLDVVRVRPSGAPEIGEHDAARPKRGIERSRLGVRRHGSDRKSRGDEDGRQGEGQTAGDAMGSHEANVPPGHPARQCGPPPAGVRFSAGWESRPPIIPPHAHRLFINS